MKDVRMSFELGWVIQGRVLYTKYKNKPTIDELAKFLKLRNYLLSRYPHETIYVIKDFTALQVLPTNIRSLMKMVQHSQPQANVGTEVLYGFRYAGIEILAKLVCRMMMNKFHIVRDYNEAITLLQTIDDTLPDLRFRTIPTQDAALFRVGDDAKKDVVG